MTEGDVEGDVEEGAEEDVEGDVEEDPSLLSPSLLAPKSSCTPKKRTSLSIPEFIPLHSDCPR